MKSENFYRYCDHRVSGDTCYWDGSQRVSVTIVAVCHGGGRDADVNRAQGAYIQPLSQE